MARPQPQVSDSCGERGRRASGSYPRGSAAVSSAGAPSGSSQVDLLHPLTSLEWSKCTDMPFGVRDAQAVWLNGKLYIGGGFTSSVGDESIILCSDGDMKSWTSIKSPTSQSALTTYQGKLVLVGGEKVASGQVTNKLLSLKDDGAWAEELPPMLTLRREATALSIDHHLLVAGGHKDVSEDSHTAEVEIFDGRRWLRAQPLPKAAWHMKSAFFHGEWYLMGGFRQDRSVFSATVDTLIASASAGGEMPTVWKTLPEAPLDLWQSSTAVVGGHLLAIGGTVAGTYLWKDC